MPSNASRSPQGQGFNLEDLPGFPSKLLRVLNEAGIHTTAELLQAAPNLPSQRQLARSLNLRDQEISKWAAMADLARVPGVGTQYCGVLLHSGIGSLQQLAQADAGRVHRHILRFQVSLLQRKDRCPALADVLHWIQLAKQMK